MMKKSKQLFISKNITEIKLLIDFCLVNKIELIAHSFLQFEALDFKIAKGYEAIFFGSPRAVYFYFQQEKLPENTLVGCVGDITAASLKEYGITPSFVGSNAGNPSEVGQQFKLLVEDKKVLFPQSLSSNRSIASLFPENQLQEVSIYKTVVKPLSIPKCDTYVFTSPSNVDGFLLENTIPIGKKVIAWGKTTEKYLVLKGFDVDKCLDTASVDELICLL